MKRVITSFYDIDESAAAEVDKKISKHLQWLEANHGAKIVSVATAFFAPKNLAVTITFDLPEKSDVALLPIEDGVYRGEEE